MPDLQETPARLASGDRWSPRWGIFNDPVGTYPNNELGYLFRSLIVVAGGTANIGLDAIYPTLRVVPDPVDGNTETLDGNHTYTLTFTPPTPNPPLPAEGTYPPMVADSSGGDAVRRSPGHGQRPVCGAVVGYLEQWVGG